MSIAIRLVRSNELIAMADLPPESQEIGVVLTLNCNGIEATFRIVGVIPGKAVFIEQENEQDA